MSGSMSCNSAIQRGRHCALNRLLAASPAPWLSNNLGLSGEAAFDHDPVSRRSGRACRAACQTDHGYADDRKAPDLRGRAPPRDRGHRRQAPQRITPAFHALVAFALASRRGTSLFSGRHSGDPRGGHHGFWTRCFALVAWRAAADRSAAGIVLAQLSLTTRKAPRKRRFFVAWLSRDRRAQYVVSYGSRRSR